MAPPKSSAKPSMLSEEYVADSSDEEDLEVTAQKNGSFEKCTESSSAKSATAKKKVARHADKKLAVQEKASSSEAASGEEEASDKEDDEVEDNSCDDGSGSSTTSREDSPEPTTKKRPTPNSAAPEPQRKKTRPTPKTPVTLPTKPFQPPNGYENIVFSPSDYAAESTDFLFTNMSRKQIWHITAPASIDMRSVKHFSILDAQNGKPIFSQHGVDYGFSRDAYQSETLYLADGSDCEYTQSRVAMARTFHLREITRSTKSDSSSQPTTAKTNSDSPFTAQQVPPRTPARQQPEGLRMRYQPFGSVEVHEKVPSSRNSSKFHVPAEVPKGTMEAAESKMKKKSKNAGEQDIEITSVPAVEDVGLPENSSVNGQHLGESNKASQDDLNGGSGKKDKKRRKRKHKLMDEIDA